ncbi:MAG: DUF6288 domain-containing protein [Verrucomicrobiales bacterium]|nr:DUF6288 domain-containing protein [Verrucomicrobiota bacterium JB025]
MKRAHDLPNRSGHTSTRRRRLAPPGAILKSILSLGIACGLAHAAGEGPKSLPPVPDLTKGDTRDEFHDWTLGPTGARGWIHAWKKDTIDARQILITKVDRETPADGVLQVGDVILGTHGTPFESDARKAFGWAIARAESTEGAGQLPIIRWRDGKTETVTLQLQTLGDYSATAPYDCAKSKLIFEQGCRAIAKRYNESSRRGNAIERSLNALALLASGNPEYKSIVAEEARWAADYQIRELKGFQSWWYGYSNLFLAEYVLATGDKSVMHGLRRTALEIANGQSRVGTWGHTFANKDTGVLYGYGAMCAPTLSLNMSLALAREAGVRDPAIDRAIAKSSLMLSFYTGKGAIPYGDHHPWTETHDDNGKCGAAAVMFDLLGDAKSTEFFSRMTTASWGSERDGGHTGNFLNILWAMPGVARSGPQATGAWMKEFAWYYDLARRSDGSFLYQGEPGVLKKDHKFAGWDSTGAYLLAYAMPLKSLRLTGRKPSVAPQMDAAEAAMVVSAGRDWNRRNGTNYSKYSTEDLIAGLGSWSPIVRERCASTLASGDDDVIQNVLALLESGSAEEKLGACAFFRVMGPRAAPAVDALTRTLSASDLWLRIEAANSLAAIGPAARSAVPKMLEMASVRDASDPRGMTQRYLAFALFQPRSSVITTGLISGSLDGIDRKAINRAVVAILTNDDGRARGAISSIFKNLTYDEIKPLMPAIHKAIVDLAPSGLMFADTVRLNGLTYLAQHHIEEGMELAVDLIEVGRWGLGKRIKPCLAALTSYGSAAKSQLPALRKMEAGMVKDGKGPKDKNLQLLREAIAKIESAKSAPKLQRLPRG